MRSALPQAPRYPVGHRWALPALLLLFVQVGLYAWMAPRGFEFTDEAYYFHNFLHWREFTGTVTFFGAYFEWPFRAMGSSVGGIRMMSLAIVLASGAVLMHAVLRYSTYEKDDTGVTMQGIRDTGWYLIGPMASSMLYFGYLATLRAPSYNLLSLFTIAICTACLLHYLTQPPSRRAGRALALVYGLSLGACFLSKATTSAIMVIGHMVFFLAVNRHWQLKPLLQLFGMVTAGFMVNLLLLTLEFPQWLASLREGIGIMGTRSNYGIGQMLLSLRWDVQNALERTGPLLVAAALMLFLARHKLLAGGHRAISWVAIAFIAASAVGMVHEKQTRLWLVGMAAAAVALWFLERLDRPSRALLRGDRSQLALMALLFYLPVAFSFGSNMSVFGHSAMASIFAFCAVYQRLYSLAHQRKLTDVALATCCALLCMPALLAQAWAMYDPEYTYRQLTGFAKQTMPVTVGMPASRLWVDDIAHGSLRSIAGMAAQAGFEPGMTILDLTGDGPGFIYAVGARPLGTPWMLGGYPGSDAAAARIIGKIDTKALRTTWLLTSSDNPLRVKDWDTLLAQRIGAGSHKQAASGRIANPYAFTPTAPKTIGLQLWRPVTPAH